MSPTVEATELGGHRCDVFFPTFALLKDLLPYVI